MGESWGRGRTMRLFMVVVGLFALAVVGAPAGQAFDGAGSISGRVTDHLGNPLADICVEARGDSGTHWHWTSQDGTYKVNGLPAGSFRVTFGCWTGDWLRETYDDLGDRVSSGTPVDVADGEAVTGIDADLVKGATVAGRVIDDLGAPVSGGWVNVWPTTDTSASAGGGMVESDGTFRVNQLVPGVYKVSAGMQGNTQYTYPAGDGMVLSSGRLVDDATIVVPARGRASGRVTDADGAAVAGACVTVAEKAADPSHGVAWTTTDSTGAWTTDVPRGRFTVFAKDCDVVRDVATTFLGGGNRAEAAEFDILGHDDVSGLDIAARRGGAISGVLTLDGSPLVGACITAFAADSDNSWGSTQTDSAGAFVVGALRPGDHKVHASSCGDPERFLGQTYGGEPGPRDVGTLIPVVDENETSGIDFGVSRPGAIEGVVRNDVGEPMSDACVVADAADYAEVTLSNARTDAAGAYRLTSLPAWDVKVRFLDCSFQRPRRFFPEYWQDASTHDTATSVAVTLGETVTGVDPVVETLVPGAVTGVVRQDGAPVADACVGVVNMHGHSVGARTDETGAYALSGVEPGEYAASVYDCFRADRFARQYWQGRTTRAEADPVTVAPGQTLTGIDFDVHRVVRVPVTTGIVPASGSAAGGTVVSIVGDHLKEVTGVRFGDQPATSLVHVSRNQVDAVAPSGPAGTTVDVVAEAPDGTSTPVTLTRFTYTTQPRLTSITPDSGFTAGGDEVRIAGSLLTGATAVRFGSVDAPSFAVESDTAIVVQVPAAAGPGAVDVQVVTPGGVNEAGQVTYRYVEPLPVVAAVSPAEGPLEGGNVVTVTGVRLTDASSVAFGGQPSPWFTVVDDERIDAYVPQSPTPGRVAVRVTSPLGTSEPGPGAEYEYVAAPEITALAPDRGPESGGGTVTITGTGLDRVAAVWFGWKQVAFTTESPTSLVATVPPGSGRVSVSVQSVGGTSAALPYTYVPAPVITSVSPSRGSVAGGTTTLSGAGLEFVEQVTVDGVAAPATARPDGTVEVTMPARDRGAVTIGVASAGGSSELLDAYRYVDRPAVTEVSPPEGSVLGGKVVLSGVDLVDVRAVELIELGVLVGPTSTAVTYRERADETIEVEMPPHLPGTVWLRVTTAWGTSSGSDGQYQYKAGLPQ